MGVLDAPEWRTTSIHARCASAKHCNTPALGILNHDTPDPADAAYDALLAEHKPDWAIRRARPGELSPGVTLPTRDGRRMGNAVVYDSVSYADKSFWRVITDSGSVMTMTREEIESEFYPGEWVCVLDTHPGIERMARTRLAQKDDSTLGVLPRSSG